MDGAGRVFCGAQIGCEAGKIGILRQRAGDRRQIRLDLFFVCTGAWCDGQAAVAVDDRGQALPQFELAEVRAEERCVGMAMDIDEARRDVLPCRVDHRSGGSILEIADSGDFSVRDGNVGAHGGRAGTVDELSILNQIIKHVSISFV